MFSFSAGHIYVPCVLQVAIFKGSRGCDINLHTCFFSVQPAALSSKRLASSISDKLELICTPAYFVDSCPYVAPVALHNDRARKGIG